MEIEKRSKITREREEGKTEGWKNRREHGRKKGKRKQEKEDEETDSTEAQDREGEKLYSRNRKTLYVYIYIYICLYTQETQGILRQGRSFKVEII